jgi:CRP-like cAMP-binding protein
MSDQNFMQRLVEVALQSEQRLLSRGAFLTTEGQTEKYLYYIEKGAVRIIYLTNHEEHTVRFGYEGSFINSLSSFIKQKPSEFHIEAIRKTAARAIPRAVFYSLVHSDQDMQTGYLAVVENLVAQQVEREVDLLTLSPALRLKRVLERSPNLFQQIPLKYIASYLRMSPETLSRFRNP